MNTTPQGEAVLLPCPFCGGPGSYLSKRTVWCANVECPSGLRMLAEDWNTRAALAPLNAAIPSVEPVAELYVCASITGGRSYLTPEEWSRDWLCYGPEEWKVIRMVATEIVVEKSTGPDPWADYRAAPPSAGGVLRTTREYTCGCSAEGPGDVPNYCPAHFAPPNVQSGDSGVREAAKRLVALGPHEHGFKQAMHDLRAAIEREEREKKA